MCADDQNWELTHITDIDMLYSYHKSTFVVRNLMSCTAIQTTFAHRRTGVRAAFDPRFYYPCKVCHGTGKSSEQAEVCQKCSGRGHLPK
jgi:DnaJ-class molecular chaperone